MSDIEYGKIPTLEEFVKRVREPRKPGEWDNEPDELIFIDDKTGLKCFIRRNVNPGMGILCGYVVLPEELHHLDFIENNLVKVHGGVTYQSTIPESYPGAEDIKGEIVIGFDCTHFRDLFPYDPFDAVSRTHALKRTYKNIEFVKKECTSLASQLDKLRKEKC